MIHTTATDLPLPGIAATPDAPKVVLSYGMGLDSTCLLLRWLEEPSSRDFDLSELVLVTAFTGDEFESTRDVVERHILPRLRDNGIRFRAVRTLSTTNHGPRRRRRGPGRLDQSGKASLSRPLPAQR
ncbi:hypothetical protein [Mycobacterium nebraskense]|uniref:hypothetical protein n=1 Tax=Mycobacterium nebraskense TaxID=244292 RepID=UPI001FCA1BE0|nr:hypothetical protein [Mycobacterium nebraskense]